MLIRELFVPQPAKHVRAIIYNGAFEAVRPQFISMVLFGATLCVPHYHYSPSFLFVF